MAGPKKIIGSGPTPPAAGPYSQAVRAGGFVFCSGQIPLDPSTGKLITGSVRVATDCCLRNLKAVLAAAGAKMEDVVQVTVYMTDLGKFTKMNEVYAKFFPKEPPTRVTVGVASLPKGATIEVAATALAPRV